jgi:hypothetical protein
MSLLSKLQGRLHGKPEDSKPSGEPKTVSSLESLPEDEQLKVLDYLNTVKDLHKEHGQ